MIEGLFSINFFKFFKFFSTFFQKPLDKSRRVGYNTSVIRRQQVSVKATGSPAEEEFCIIAVCRFMDLSLRRASALTEKDFFVARARRVTVFSSQWEVKPNAQQ